MLIKVDAIELRTNKSGLYKKQRNNYSVSKFKTNLKHSISKKRKTHDTE